MVDYKKDPVWVSLRDILNKSNKLYQPNLWEEKAEESELFLKELPKEITFTLTEARKRRKERSVLDQKEGRHGQKEENELGPYIAEAWHEALISYLEDQTPNLIIRGEEQLSKKLDKNILAEPAKNWLAGLVIVNQYLKNTESFHDTPPAEVVGQLRRGEIALSTKNRRLHPELIVNIISKANYLIDDNKNEAQKGYYEVQKFGLYLLARALKRWANAEQIIRPIDRYVPHNETTNSSEITRTQLQTEQIPNDDKRISVPHSIPLPPEPYIQRKRLQKKILSKLTQENTLIFSGLPGTGKYTLAKWAAHELVSQYNNGQVGIEAENKTIGEIQGEIARNFNIELKEVDLDKRATDLRNFLYDKKCLLVINNISASSDLKHLDIASGDSQLILTTSDKNVISCIEATKIEVGIATPKESLQFLPVEIRNTTEANRLVRQLGGLAIALRLVGSQLERKIYTIRELQKSLPQEGLHFFDLGPDTSRKTSFTAFFDLIYNKLPELYQHEFAQLSCFVGVFDKNALQTIWAKGRKTTDDSLKDMINLYLVESHWEGYYHLHPLLRHYARQKLETKSDLQKEAYRRHAEHYLQLRIINDLDLFSLALDLSRPSSSAIWTRELEAKLSLLLSPYVSILTKEPDPVSQSNFTLPPELKPDPGELYGNIPCSVIALTTGVRLLHFLKIYGNNREVLSQIRISSTMVIDQTRYNDLTSNSVRTINPLQLIMPEILEALFWFQNHARDKLIDLIKNWVKKRCHQNPTLTQEKLDLVLSDDSLSLIEKELKKLPSPRLDEIHTRIYFDAPFIRYPPPPSSLSENSL